MKTFFCVVSTVHDNGLVTATIVDSVEADEKPENHCTEKLDRDIYQDWFDSWEQAMQFVEDARRA